MAFSVKLQIVGGKPDANATHDYRGSEPNDEHRTIAELDPVDDAQLDWWLESARMVNAGLSRLTPANDFGHIELRIMDSDGRA